MLARHAWRSVACILFLALHVGAQDPESPSTPADASASLTFRVLDDNGNPIEGAEVAVWDESGERRAVATDDGGNARVVVVPGGVYIFVTGERRTGQERDDVWLENGDEQALEFRLDPGVPFDGRVVGSDGKPVPDVQVAVMEGGTYEGQIFATVQGDRYVDFPQPDAEGRFHVRGIPPGTIATMVAWADGYLSAEIGVKAIGDTVRPSPLILELDRGAVVTGVVHDPDGLPVAGATVYVIDADDDLRRESPDVVFMSSDGGGGGPTAAQTDAAGAFSLGGLPLDMEFVAFAVADGFARSSESPVFRTTSEEPGRKIELTLRKPSTLVVRISDPEGRPINDAPVAIGRYDFGPEKKQADEPGIYRFEALGPGSLLVRIEGRYLQYLEHREEVEVGSGEVKIMEVTLDPGVAIEGVLVDPAGRPRPDAYLRAFREVADNTVWKPGRYRSFEIKGDGRFHIAGLRPGRYRLQLIDNGFDLPQRLVEVEAPASDVRLEGLYLGTVRVRLETPDGQPFSGSTFVWNLRKGGGGGSTKKAVDGILEFRGWRGQTERIEIYIDGYLFVACEAAAGYGETIELGPFRLDPGTTREARVVDTGGAAVAGAVVHWGAYRPSSTATSDSAGRLTLEHVPPGPIDVTVDAEHFLPASRTIGTGSDAVIVLERGAWLQGIALTDEGERSGRTWLEVERPDPAVPEAPWVHDDTIIVEADGTFEARLAAGKLRIVQMLGGDQFTVVWEGNPTEGQTVTLELAIQEK